MLEANRAGLSAVPKEDWYLTPEVTANSSHLDIDIADFNCKPTTPPENSIRPRPGGFSVLPAPSASPPPPPPKTSRQPRAQLPAAPTNAVTGRLSKTPGIEALQKAEPRDKSKKVRHHKRKGPHQSTEVNSVQASDEETDLPPRKLGKSAEERLKFREEEEEEGNREAALAAEAAYNLCTRVSTQKLDYVSPCQTDVASREEPARL